MKIEVITLHGVWNYGSVLQALATQSFFEQLGCTVEFINYKRNDFRSFPNDDENDIRFLPSGTKSRKKCGKVPLFNVLFQT